MFVVSASFYAICFRLPGFARFPTTYDDDDDDDDDHDDDHDDDDEEDDD